MNNKQVDITKYLQDTNIKYWTQGKNVPKNSVNIRCIVPSCGDKSNHLSFRLGSKWGKCWKCGNKKSFTDLIKYYQHCDWKTAKDIEKKYETDKKIVYRSKEEYVQKDICSFEMPFGIDTYLHTIHKKYLVDRGYDVDEMISKYSLMSCLNKNQRYKYRIIIPIIIDTFIVNFVARDVTGKQDPSYQDLEKDIAVIPKERCLFNIDSVEEGGTICLVEGSMDAMNGGDGVVATLTTNFTIHQVNLIRKKKPKKCYIFYDNKLFDSNAEVQARKLERALWFIPEIYYIEPDAHIKDLGQMNKKEVMEFRSMVFT